MSIRIKVLGLAAVGSLAVAAGCATTNEEPQGLLKPTISYEDIDSGPTPTQAAAATSGATDGGKAAQAASPAAPADPFANCFAKQPQPGIATLDCGQTGAMIANIVGQLTTDQMEQNFAAYAKNFPADAKQDRSTAEIHGKTAHVFHLKGAADEAQMVILPHGSKHTRLVACHIQDKTPFSRCDQILEQLAVHGIPETVNGSDQLPKYLVSREKPSANVIQEEPSATDGGAAAPAPAPAPGK
jgi:hypothetical protein